MRNFQAFAASIAAQIALMSNHELFRVDIEGDALWGLYLTSFPDSENPFFRKRTEHDGSYDRSFVRKMGNIVRINSDGTVTTIWDAPNLEYPYTAVAAKLAAVVRSMPIKDLFRTKDSRVGLQMSREDRGLGQGIHTWFHFYADIHRKFQTRDVDKILGDTRTTVQVFQRGLDEITKDALDTVFDLIQQGNLYRGDENKSALVEFIEQKNAYDKKSDVDKSIYCWQNYNSRSARLRNTAFGTLLQNLSSGADIEIAVKAYERIMAPANYKRPTALITQRMVDDAEKAIDALGISDSLERRFARVEDLNVNDVLWVDNQTQSRMQGGKLSTLLGGAVQQPKPAQSIQNQIDIDQFVQKILPEAIGIELWYGNQHMPNRMSLTTAEHPDAKPLFKWGTHIGWSYAGNVTDSIKERVKAAGGNTNAVLRVSLAWFNHDDLDLHANCPDGHVYFGNPFGGRDYRAYGGQHGQNGRILDVDMNAGVPTTREPVENLSWKFPKDGKYEIYVHQFRKRETDNVGFTLEIENDGQITQLTYNSAVQDQDRIDTIEFEIVRQRIVNLRVINRSLVGRGISRENWGLPTEAYAKVKTVVLSPNHWDKQTGNKHYFFILDGCKSDEPTRGIYNEFLLPDLEQHRKVFEVLGNKTKCAPADEQLSGLGFSSTKRDKVTAKVIDRNNTTRIFEIHF